MPDDPEDSEIKSQYCLVRFRRTVQEPAHPGWEPAQVDYVDGQPISIWLTGSAQKWTFDRMEIGEPLIMPKV